MITEQKRTELVQEVQSSELAPEHKTQALAILQKLELSDDDLLAVADIIQQDIDADIAAIDPGFEEAMSTDPEEQRILAEGTAQLEAITKDLEETMNLVEEQSRAVEAATATLTEAMNQANLEEIKGRMGLAE